MTFDVLTGPPRRLRLVADHPLYPRLSALLGLAAGVVELDLPQPDAEGWIELAVPAPAAELSTAGLVLRTTGVRVRAAEPYALELAIAATLPAPLSGLALEGVVSASAIGLTLRLSPAASTPLSLAPGVVLALPAAFALEAELGAHDAALVLDAPGQPAVVTLPGGSVLVRSFELSAASLALRGGAKLTVPGALAVDVPDLNLVVAGGEVTLFARAPMVGRLAVGPLAMQLTCQHATLRVSAAGVEELSATGATLTGALGALGSFATSGSFGYRRAAEVPAPVPQTGPATAPGDPVAPAPVVIGQEWRVVIHELALPGALDRLAPEGELEARMWPDQDAFEVRTRLAGELPFLGRVGPVEARIAKLGVPIELELDGLTSPALSFGPDLPALTLGPCRLRAVLDRVLSGTVEDEFGQSLADHTVALRDRGGATLDSAVTGEDGGFEFYPVDPAAVRVHVEGRRVVQLGPLADQAAGEAPGGDYALVAFEAEGVVPLDVPAGFPVLSSARIEVALQWQRGQVLALEFPNGLPPIALGPLRLRLISLAAARTTLADGDNLTELELAGALELHVPLVDEPLAIEAGSVRAQWREHGARRLAVEGATLTLPSGLPLFGGALLTGSLEIESLPPGSAQAAAATGFALHVAPTSLPAIEVVAGIRVVPSDDVALELALAPGESAPRLSLASGSVELELPFGTLTLEELVLSEERWSVAGSAVLDLGAVQDVLSIGGGTAALEIDRSGWTGTLALTDLAFDVGPIHLAAASVAGSMSHAPERDELRLDVTGVELGPLNLTADGQLVVVERRLADGATEREAFVELALDWADLDQAPALLPHWPLPFPTSGALTVTLRWAQTAGGHDVTAHLRGEADDVGDLFAFLPASLRPEVDAFGFTLSVSLADSDLAGVEVAADVALRLPDLAALGNADLVRVWTGDESGLVRATLRAGFEAVDDLGDSDDDGRAYLAFELVDAVALELSLPGMPQDAPAIEAALTEVAFELEADAELENLGGVLRARGAFTLRPPDPPPFVPLGHHVRALLEQTGLDVISGTLELALGFSEDGAALEAIGRFDGAALEVDLFQMLADLTRGSGAAQPSGEGDGSEIELSLEAGFELLELRFAFGPSLAELAAGTGGDAPSFAVGFGVAFHLGELAATLDFKLSDRELALTLGTLRIPLQVPVFPLEAEHLEGLVDEAAWDARRAALEALLAAIPEPPPGTTNPERAHAAGRLGAFDGVRIFWRKAENNRDGYLANAQFAVNVLRAATLALHVDTTVALELTDTGFFFPFADPSSIRVQGQAALVGFAPDDPLGFLGALRFGLGLSADRIYFQLQTTGPIALPDFTGRYPGASLDISQLAIGYGYTRNSLAVNVAGQLILPERLVADADTSSTWGAGVRLPTHNRLGFRLDIIPVTLGPVEFVVPLLEFEVDLRRPNSPGVADLTTCEPFWDGLQVHVPGVIRADFKHIAFTPFFTMLPMPNLRLDWDLELGDERGGLRIVANDFHYFAGLLVNAGVPIPISFLASPLEPYFENLCVRLNVAGFGIQFDLERPFPSVSPLALFEVLGLISDPLMPVDPGGHLANTVRISLKHARITVPENLRRLFPDVPGVDKDLDVTLNLGTVITGFQTIWSALEPALDALVTGAGDLQARLEELRRNPPEVDSGALLALLPAELRKVRVRGSLGGFEAGAVLLVIAPDEAAAEFERRGAAAPAPPTTLAFDPATSAAPEDVARLRPRLAATPFAKRHVDPEDPAANLFGGIEFDAFEAEDFEHVPLPRNADQAGIVIGAHVTLAPGQRFRFLGALWEDGSFGLTSAAEVDGLVLNVAGIEFPCPLSFAGRLTLEGRARRYGSRARVTAEFSLTNWRPLWPLVDLARVDVPSGKLSLDSSGSFLAAGEGTLQLFWGAVAMSGRVEVTNTHCFVEGYAAFELGDWGGEPAVALRLGDKGKPETYVRARVGPGHRFELGGSASASILGQQVFDVRAQLTERGAALEAQLSSLALAGWSFPEFALALRGELEWSGPDAGRFLLEGAAELALGGRDGQGRPLPGTVLLRGRGGVRGDASSASCYAEGALWWQGCRWASGRIEVGTAGIALSGGTSFEVELTPSATPFGTEFATLVLRVALDGAFELGLPALAPGQGLGDLAWDLGAARLEGECVLGLRLPSAEGGGAAHDQVLALARQRFGGRLDLGELDLVELDRLRLLPFQDQLSIQVPQIDVDTDDPWVLEVQHRTTDDPTLAFTLGNVVRFHDATTNWYFPWKPDKNLQGNAATNQLQRSVAISVPRISVPGTFHTLSLNPAQLAQVSLRLVWTDGALAVRYRFGSLQQDFSVADLVQRVGHAADLLDG